ncbi:MAG: HAMP domain-containing sensor histidine kinase [Sphaerochaeta sp.]|nr:HAMP domain-containing sensor histidine kinase [Sphaerochaeta sp.]
MNVAVLLLFFLLPSVATLQQDSSARLSWILTIVLGLLSLLALLGAFLQTKGKKNPCTSTFLLLGFTAIALFSTSSTSASLSFSPWIILYNTLVLLLWGYVLSLHLPFSAKNLWLIGSLSCLSCMASLLFSPFSSISLLLGLLPLGTFIWEHHKKERSSSASRISLQSMLAHEIRTPLTVMQTSTSLLLEEIPGPLNAQQQQFVRSNYEYTQRLITFSENMLMLLKFGKEFEPKMDEKINIRLVTRDIVAFFGPLLQIKQQSIRYSFPALLSTPYGDENLIRQVFINLIHNATKHSREGGEIFISVTQDDEQVVVSISDHGKGVVGEGRENLFREFYQEKTLPEEFHDGFGLGLSIARQIVEKHGGKVYITSVKDKGTVVSFTLPAKAVR